MSGLYDDLGQLARLAVNAAADAVTGLAATLRDTLNPCDLWSQPVGEVPDLPPCVPAPAWATAPAPVPGGGSPAAAGDHSTSALLDAAAHRLASMASGRACHSDALDDLITDLHERAEKFRAIEAMPMPLADLIADASDELLHRAYDDEPASPAFLQRLSRDLFRAEDLPTAEKLVRRALEGRLGGEVLPIELEDEITAAFRDIDPRTGEVR